MEDSIYVNSDSEEDEHDDNSQSSDFSFSHNNNGSFTEHKILSTQQVYELMEHEMKKVQDVVPHLSASKTRSLLNEFKWDAGKLLEFALDSAKSRRVKELFMNAWQFAACDIRKSFECQICIETVSPNSIRKLECNHRFCVECLTGYLLVTVADGGLVSNAINCPGFKCRFELEDGFVLDLLEEEKLKGKYLQIIANSFVQNNRSMKWCPNANCQRAVQLEWFDSSIFRESVRCGCGISFCFKCHELSHDPVECSLLLEWARVKVEDCEAKQWILLNTKACPKCNVNIQKNGGCMHITCKCRYEFCWVCMGVWNRVHHCAPKDAVASIAQALKDIRRFSTYNAKHETMNQAYNLDVAQYKHKLDQGTTELELEKQWIKVEFVTKAIEILLHCRRNLMFSYVFSYFMTTVDNQMEIFEQNLIYLEQYTEQLSEILEGDVTATNVGRMKEKMIDASALCEKSRRNLMDHVNEGYEKNWWRKFPIPVEELLAAVSEDVIHGLLY